jgi:hypothetical protein
MHIRIILAAAFLGIANLAAAEFTTIEEACEIPLSLLRVPASTNGNLMFRQCADCEQLSVPMTGKTEFLSNGEQVLLKDFRKSLFRIRDRDSETIVVRRHLRSNTITAIKVTD